MNMNRDQIILEGIYMEMAYGLSGSGEDLTTQELMDHIIALDKMKRGAMNVSFTAITVPQYRKTGFPYSNLYKVKQVQGQIGDDYGAGVQRIRDREGVEGDFKPLPSSAVKEYLSPSVGISFQNNPVLIYTPKLVSNPSYFFTRLSNGTIEELDKNEVKPFLRDYKPSERQGTDDKKHRINYKFDGIAGMKIEGKDYKVIDNEPLKQEIFDMVRERLKV